MPMVAKRIAARRRSGGWRLAAEEQTRLLTYLSSL
jgi:hypothetical protein